VGTDVKGPAKRGRGRPPLSGETGERYQVTIPPGIASAARQAGSGSLSGGISLKFRHMMNLRQMIDSNQRQIALLESGKAAIGSGSPAGSAGAAAAEASRLRKKTEELQALLRQEEAFERRQKAFLAVHQQFQPNGVGQPSENLISEFNDAEAEWRAAKKEVDRIVKEFRAGLR
jgi:hypothetical protein